MRSSDMSGVTRCVYYDATSLKHQLCRNTCHAKCYGLFTPIETEAKLDVFLPPCSFQYEQLSAFFSKPSSQQYRFSCSFPFNLKRPLCMMHDYCVFNQHHQLRCYPFLPNRHRQRHLPQRSLSSASEAHHLLRWTTQLYHTCCPANKRSSSALI